MHIFLAVRHIVKSYGVPPARNHFDPALSYDALRSIDYAIGSQVPVRTKTKLKAAATTHMEMLQAIPDRVKSYFDDPRCAYAA